LANGVRARLSAFKVPTRWLITTDPATVPRLASEKVDVEALRSLLSGERAAAAAVNGSIRS
jgi:hypothetical protein